MLPARQGHSSRRRRAPLGGGLRRTLLRLGRTGGPLQHHLPGRRLQCGPPPGPGAPPRRRSSGGGGGQLPRCCRRVRPLDRQMLIGPAPQPLVVIICCGGVAAAGRGGRRPPPSAARCPWPCLVGGCCTLRNLDQDTSSVLRFHRRQSLVFVCRASVARGRRRRHWTPPTRYGGQPASARARSQRGRERCRWPRRARADSLLLFRNAFIYRLTQRSGLRLAWRAAAL